MAATIDGTDQTMTARDATGFYVVFLRSEVAHFFPRSGAMFELNYTDIRK